MKEEVLGVWSAHGEGRMVKDDIFDGAVKYVDYSENITKNILLIQMVLSLEIVELFQKMEDI